jgi:hypothetical protein
MLYPGSDLSKKEADRLEHQRATKSLVFSEFIVSRAGLSIRNSHVLKLPVEKATGKAGKSPKCVQC